MTGYNYEVFIDHCIHMAENRITDNSHCFLSQVQLLGERLISLSRFLEKDRGVSWGQVPTWDPSAWAKARWPRVGMLCRRGCWKPAPVGRWEQLPWKEAVGSWADSSADVHTICIPFHGLRSSLMSFYVTYCVSVPM